MSKLDSWKRSGHSPALILLQVVIITLFALFGRYDPKSAMKGDWQSEDGTVTSVKNSKDMVESTYAMYQDVHAMIVIGIGFLISFLKNYGLSSVSFNFLGAVITMEWAILVIGFSQPQCVDPNVEWKDCDSSWPYINLNLMSLLGADFCAAAILITFCVLLGKITPLQLIIMAIIEVAIYVANDVIGRIYIGAVDVGCTIFIHTFAAYFGLAVSWVLYKKSFTESKKEVTTNNNDLFAMIGTIFLWLFYPSFNASGVTPGDAQQRAILNTYLSLCASAMSTFAVSSLINPDKKFGMEYIQNASIAGGVMVGASADMMLTPAGAITAGSLGGFVSTCGFKWVSPFLQNKMKIHDTAGVNNLHGMPGIMGGIISIIMAAIATPEQYSHHVKHKHTFGNESLLEVFPGLATGTTNMGQARLQLAALATTMAIAIVGGLITGVILKLVGKFDSIEDDDLYNDERNIVIHEYVQIDTEENKNRRNSM